MRTTTLALTTLATLAVAASGCAPTLPVDHWRLPEVDVGSARSLVVLEGDGRPGAVAQVTDRVVQEARADGYFDVDGARRGREERTLTLVVDVLERHVVESTDSTTVVDGAGVQQTSMHVTTTATFVIAATVIDEDGAVLLDGAELEGVATAETDDGAYVDADALLAEAAFAAARGVLDLTTPTVDVVRVRLDDEDEAQRAILDVAEDGALEPALDQLRAYRAAHDTASARYNEGAILDALGRYDEALVAYDDALAAGPKDYYATTRTDCADRAAVARALGI